ncbi:hypothetical protein DUZ99_19720 [Xylanibacillus composti]|uniref:Copper amine oxidase-like N-terminal domain-containing protein n=1 Tax=Xylanibacillus composti TaxID=1572762 RepID=A0A8J4M435_9BACL|nr:hypothetical protein [Xylanibacillus composti]GIQ71494.1 hypothetical protein XYCOK13_43180 [Xylanibacillus composti]
MGLMNLRFVAEALGASIHYDQDTQTITVSISPLANGSLKENRQEEHTAIQFIRNLLTEKKINRQKSWRLPFQLKCTSYLKK